MAPCGFHNFAQGIMSGQGMFVSPLVIRTLLTVDEPSRTPLTVTQDKLTVSRII